VVIDEGDNVATAIDDIQPGETLTIEVGGRELAITAAELIRFGHKLALKPLPERSDVIKYNEVIGTTTRDIGVGEHVHVHNVVSNRANAQRAEAAGGGGAGAPAR
jgi:altronate dehydratase small subunit